MTEEQVELPHYAQAYTDSPIVRWQTMAVDPQVAGTPFCDLHWQMRDGMWIVGSAIDNLFERCLIKRCNVNLRFGFAPTTGLM